MIYLMLVFNMFSLCSLFQYVFPLSMWLCVMEMICEDSTMGNDS